MGDLLNSEGWRIVIHECKAPETGYWGEVPAMPGCASQGATQEVCRTNVLEAAAGCLEAYLEFAMNKLSSGAPVRKMALA
jgi:predicted RNase H-like HicB family nuclease